MDEFLEDYVVMLAEANDTELTEDQVEAIVNNLRAEDGLWDTVDFYVNNAIAEIVEDEEDEEDEEEEDDE